MEENKYTFENPEYRHTYWHTCSHIMAQAIKRLWPEVQLTIGPAIDEGLYYDIDAPFAFTPEDLARDRGEMRKICKEKLKLERFELPRARGAEASWRTKAALQGGAHQRPAGGRDHLLLQAGRVHRPVRRPAPGLHRPREGQRHEAHRLQRRLLARRREPRDPPAHLRHRLPEEGRAGRLSPAHRGGQEARPPQAGQGTGPLYADGRGSRLPLLPAEGHGAAQHPDRLLARGATSATATWRSPRR